MRFWQRVVDPKKHKVRERANPRLSASISSTIFGQRPLFTRPDLESEVIDPQSLPSVLPTSNELDSLIPTDLSPGNSKTPVSIDPVETVNIDDGDVTNAKLADMKIWSFKCRNDAAEGDPQDQSRDDFDIQANPLASDYLIGWGGLRLKRFQVTHFLGGSGEINDGENVGSGADIFKDKSGLNLRFRGILPASTKLTSVVNGDNIDIDLGVVPIDALDDVDNVTNPPALNDVLKWDGTNYVPGTAGDTSEFTFSIDSFAGTQTDSVQLIGAGVWVTSGNMSFSATYSNAPGSMTALVTMTGNFSGWSTLVMDPVIGAEPTVVDTSFNGTVPGNTVTFTLTQSADASTATDTVTFNNTIRYGTNTDAQGALTDSNCEALTEVGGPSENLNQTLFNPSTAGTHYVHFAYPARLSTIKQVQMDDGFGFASAAFAAAATTLLPDVQTVNLTAVANSATYSEAFEAVTSKLVGLTNGTRDFRSSTSTTAVNYIYWGEVAVNSGAHDAQMYTAANVTDNYADETESDHPGKEAGNSISNKLMTVNAGIGQYTYIAYPSRLGPLTAITIFGSASLTDFWWDAGVGTELAITNSGGYTENYYVYVSKNPEFLDPTPMTVTI